MEIYTENKPLPMPLREPEPMVLKDLEDREIPAYDENTFQKSCSCWINTNAETWFILPGRRMFWKRH